MQNTLKPVIVKNVAIGEDAPKICVPLVGETIEQLKEEAIFLTSQDFDVIEWRVDFYEHVEDIEKVKEALAEIRLILPSRPIIFTFRSAKEGGEKEVSTAYYVELNQAVAATGQVDIVDAELFTGDAEVKAIIDEAHKHHVYVIISNHDFDKTPSKEEIVSRLRKAQELGGDIPKLAAMPQSVSDVLMLMDATYTMKEEYADRPIITMSMAGKGVISRIAGELFGSALTFGAAKKASAPGQVPVEELRSVLNMLHKHM